MIELTVDHTFQGIMGVYVVFRDGAARRTLRREPWNKTEYTRGQVLLMELDTDGHISWPARPRILLPSP